MVRIVNRAHSVVDLNGSRICDWYGALWRLALNFGHSPASDTAKLPIGRLSGLRDAPTSGSSEHKP